MPSNGRPLPLKPDRQGRPSLYDPSTGKKRDWYCEDVLSGKLTVRKIWEDDRVLAFHHSHDLTSIHAVAIPKKHVESILHPDALDGALLSSMLSAVQRVAQTLGLNEKGFFVRANAARPEVTPHMHWHIMSLEEQPSV